MNNSMIEIPPLIREMAFTPLSRGVGGVFL